MGISFFSQRFLLTAMAFAGLVNAYLMRLCLNIAILKMVKENSTDEKGRNSDFTREMFRLARSSVMDVYSISDVLDSEETYDWSRKTQGLVKAAFFIGYAAVHVPASFLGQKFGGKNVLNIGLLLTALCTLITPLVIHYGGPNALIVLRCIMGIGEAPCYPALIYLLSCWIPVQERGRVSSVVFCAGQIGSIISNLLTGFALQYIKGYATIFYIFGAIGLIWNISFHFLVYDTPAKHPRISAEEKEYLQKEIGELVEIKTFLQIPWTSMLTCGAVIVLIIAEIGHDWGFYILVTEMPTYLNKFIGFDYKEVAVFTSVPFLASYIFSVIAGYLCDYIVTRNIVTLTQARKIFTGIGALVAAIFLIAISYAGYNKTFVVIWFVMAMGAMAGFYTGAQANFLDLCPNYSGALMGLVNGTGAVAGFLVPYLTGIITENEPFSAWRTVFWISFGVLFTTVCPYLIWGSGEIQSWNDNDEDDWIKRQFKRCFIRKTA